MQVCPLRPIYTYTLALSTTPTSNARSVPVGTSTVRVVATTDSWLSISGAAAEGTGVLLPAGHVEYFHVAAGDTLNAVSTGSTGTLSVAEVSR